MLKWRGRALSIVIACALAPATVAAGPPTATQPPADVATEPSEPTESMAEAPPEIDPPATEDTPTEDTPTEDAPPTEDTPTEGTPTDEAPADAPAPGEPDPTLDHPAEPPEVADPSPSPLDVETFEPTGTRVELEGGAPGELELFRIEPDAGDRAVGTVDGIPYVRVCVSPCVDPVQIDEGAYFVAGAKVMPSRPFTLAAHADRPSVRLHVRPGPRAIRFAGFGLVVGGAVLVPGGGLLVGAVDRGRASDIAGYVLIGTGIAALAAGIALVIRGRTLVRVPKGAPPRLSPHDWARDPNFSR